MNKIELISDSTFETNVQKFLQHARQLMQDALNEFFRLFRHAEIVNQPALYELIHNPAIPYSEEVQKLDVAPGLTPEQVKKTVPLRDRPDPSRLYQLCNEASHNQYCARELSLFNVKDKEVVLTNHCQGIIKSRSVFAFNEAQKEYFDKLKQFLDDLNSLNDRVNGRLLTDNSRLGLPFKPPAREVEGYHTIEFKPEGLSELLKNIK